MIRFVPVILFVICYFSASVASGQTVSQKKIKPGKEKIVLELPKEQRWRSQRIRKDVPSIRVWSYYPTRTDTAALAVKTLETSTIDRRYYPIRARRTMADKITLMRQDDSTAHLEILREKTENNRTSLIYLVFSSEKASSEQPASKKASKIPVLLALAVEGPTAFHSVEIPFAATNEVSPDIIDQWVAILTGSRIE